MSTGTDKRLWSSSILIGIGFAAVAMSYSIWAWQIFYGQTGAWMQNQDVWQLVDAGRFVAHGALGYVYQGSGSYALPLSFILIAPASAIVDRFHLVEGAPFPVPHPSAWLVVAPYTLLFGIFLLHAVRRLAWELGVRSRLWVVQLGTVAIVLIPCFEWGHFEDVMALTAVLHGLRVLLRQDFVKAGLWFAVAVSFKQWALMLIPFAVAMAPSGRRLRTLVAATALPAAFSIFVLGVDWTDASKALFSPTTLLRGYQGHEAIFQGLLGAKTSAVTRTLGLVVAGAVGWRARSVRLAPAVLAVAGLILIVRPLFEPIVYSYYLSPAFLMAGLVGLIAHRRLRVSDWTAPIVATVWSLPRGNPASAGLWWAGECVLLIIISLQVMSNCGVHISVKNLRPKPILHPMTTVAGMGD